LGAIWKKHKFATVKNRDAMSVPQNKLPMKPKAESIPFQLSLMRIKHENVSWSNILINSPITYNLLERRTMYFLTGEVKRKFVEKGLGVPDNWKDLYFYLTDEDLGLIGGSKNVPRTYEVLSTMGEKFVTVRYLDENGDEIIGKLHWVDTFFYDPKKDLYAVRVSPEIMPYLINLNKNFTCFDVGTAMKLRSKYTQKMYELCCRFGGDYTHYEHEQFIQGNVYKKRVVPISMDDFRQLFNLDEIRDPKTGKVLQPASLENFKDMRRSILDAAQDELLTMYLNNASNVWFDFQAGPRKGIGGKTSSIIIYIYTRENPKDGLCRPWQKGDEDLYPYEPPYVEKAKKTPQQKLHANIFYGADNQEQIVISLLSKYLSKQELTYYMAAINREAKKCRDSYTQVIQVILEKEKQPKFSKAKKQYKRNNIIEYALQENLKEYGWYIEPPKNYKQVYKQQELFR
jgi:hypothetical protein